MAAPGLPGQGGIVPCDTAIQAMEDEQDIRNGSDRHKAKPAGKDNQLLPLCFPEKLWKMLESDQFQSIWWSEGGKCVAINKDLFEVEVLGRGVCQQVFNTQHIRSVIRQLNLYGFTKVQRDFQRSASLPEFLAEETAASAHSQVQQLLCTATNACNNLGERGTFTANKALPQKRWRWERVILYYYNPSFNRAHPWLLGTCKRRGALKQRALCAAGLDKRPLQKPRWSVWRDMQLVFTCSWWDTAKLSRAMAMERDFSSLRFPQKLWKMLESGKFQSIWWSESGKCVAINKDLFEVEVLGREGQRVFHTQKIKSFIRQLNAYGFTKMQWNFQRSASLPEFLAEEAAASAHSQVQQLLCTATNACVNLGSSTTITPASTEHIPGCQKRARGEVSLKEGAWMLK
ncbi:Heat shock transcription factor, Y-linked [Lonchura striata]|uniref:Heat shock transcription factor, Y-linked n=1 Tax=Lonchura striata TaxID=40157 RepID=A0A218VD22_9PASE|nr:Heat shock transcription factor, Y-linked [Lonchura striata domestica]